MEPRRVLHRALQRLDPWPEHTRFLHMTYILSIAGAIVAAFLLLGLIGLAVEVLGELQDGL